MLAEGRPALAREFGRSPEGTVGVETSGAAEGQRCEGLSGGVTARSCPDCRSVGKANERQDRQDDDSATSGMAKWQSVRRRSGQGRSEAQRSAPAALAEVSRVKLSAGRVASGIHRFRQRTAFGPPDAPKGAGCTISVLVPDLVTPHILCSDSEHSPRMSLGQTHSAAKRFQANLFAAYGWSPVRTSRLGVFRHREARDAKSHSRLPQVSSLGSHRRTRLLGLGGSRQKAQSSAIGRGGRAAAMVAHGRGVGGAQLVRRTRCPAGDASFPLWEGTRSPGEGLMACR